MIRCAREEMSLDFKSNLFSYTPLNSTKGRCVWSEGPGKLRIKQQIKIILVSILAHDFVGISQGFTKCISDGRETVMEHHTGVKKAKYLKKAEQLKKLQQQWILENTSAKENAM